jgi:hypothetical protein
MEIFNALTQPEMIQVFTRGEVKMASEAKNDMTFSYLGGNIEGKYTEVTPYTQIGIYSIAFQKLSEVPFKG